MKNTEILSDKFGHESQDFKLSCIRNDYLMMLVGGIPSPLGPRREVKLADFADYGTFTPCTTPPTESGEYLVEGTYGSFDGQWDSAILPAWYHADENEWECVDGAFEPARQWLQIPYLPDVWAAAVALNENTPELRNVAICG